VEEPKYIKYVANYLRKSRGDSEADLDKHKKVLRELCTENNWTYIEYLEIGSGDSISARPIFQSLLNDIQSGLFDAVCVMDIDRLGRGDMGDQDKIKKIFISSQTYVITPQQIYDLSNDDDEFVVDMKSFIARREYKQIVKRLIQGKRIGARMGMWTNGTPPYPYEYERYKDKYNPKGIVVNDDKLVVYRLIIDSIINKNMTSDAIAHMLNKNEIPAPRINRWVGITINRIAKDETHLGKIITNKTKGNGHVGKNEKSTFKRMPRDEWIVVENCHEAVKTLEEHEKILLQFNKRTLLPHRKTPEIKPLNGLIKCGMCGHTMTVISRTDRKNPESIKPCWYKNAFGEKCKNQGMITDIIYDVINKEINKYSEELMSSIKNSQINQKYKSDKQQLQILQKEINSKNKAIERISEAFEAGVYSLQEFKERKDKTKNQIEKMEEQINLLNISLKQEEPKDKREKILKLQNFKNIIIQDNLTDKDKNKLYKSIINKILWLKNDKDISITIEFN
jgi:site-specific DNA recombinase